MKRFILFSFLSLAFWAQSFGQCTPVDCSAILPPYGGICDSILIDGLVNQPYSDFESYVITENCFDAGLIDPTQAGTQIRITNVDNFVFSQYPAGLVGQTNQASYQPFVVGCASLDGTPTEAGFFRIRIDFLADVELCGIFPIPVNDNASNYEVLLNVLPDASFTGLASSYCPTDGDVTMTVTGYTGGTFSGPGVTGNVFSPAAAGPGTHTITYTVSAQEGLAVGPATNSSSMTVTIGQDIYVDGTAAGANDGSSWADAYTDLQMAFDAIIPGCNANVHIAEGTYKNGPFRSGFFSISNTANVYGGYPAGGGMADPATYTTTLSGDVDGDGTLAGNTFHVIRVDGGGDVLLDGLTIEGGNADGDILTQFGISRGGGVFINGASCTINNCHVTNNFAGLGGGVFATLSNLTRIDGTLLDLNTAERGSALYHSNETNMYIMKSTITANTSTNRCAVEINNSNYTLIEQSIIAENISTNANAVALIATNRDQGCDIVNTTLVGEAAKNRSLFSMQVGFGDVLNVNVSNSIIAHKNESFHKNVVVFNNNILNFNATNSYFSGDALNNLNGVGTHNIVETNVLYAFVAGSLLMNPNYSVQPCSPVVDAGDNAIAGMLESATDINGDARISGAAVDMGAYEKQFACRLADAAPSQKETIFNDEISVYPNPFNDVIYLKTDLENITVRIVDILGRNVMETSNTNTIEVGELPKGTYIMNVFQDGELRATEKLLKK